jgi:hypothetical protein
MKLATRVRLACIVTAVLGTAGESTAQTGRNDLHLQVCLALMDQLSAQGGSVAQTAAAAPVSSSQGGTPSVTPLSDSTATSSAAVNDMTNTVLGLMGNSNTTARIRELQAALTILDELDRLNLSQAMANRIRIVRAELIARLNLLLSSTTGTALSN